MSEEEINKIVKEHYGFTVEEIDENVGRLSFEVDELEKRINKALDFINAWKKEKVFKVSMIDLMQIEDFLKGDKE